MQLSTRLETIISLVPPSETLADVGCDHGFVSIALIERGICRRAIASDVNAGPLEQAGLHVRDHQLSEKIDCRLGGGLSVLQPGEADTILIAGMGGQLMRTILLDHPDTVRRARALVLSPHREPDAVRSLLPGLGFCIDREELLLEDDKYYVVIRAIKTEEPVPALTDAETLYGPDLIRRKPPLFLQYLSKEKLRAEKLITSLTAQPSSPSVETALRTARDRLNLLNSILA